MVILGIWLIISNAYLIKKFVNAKFSIHEFEEVEAEGDGFVLLSIMVDVGTIMVLAFAYSLWILPAIIWGLIGLYVAKEIFIDKSDFIELSKLSRIWCFMNFLIIFLAVCFSPVLSLFISL